MTALANTKENAATVSALKKVANTKWSGTTVHDTMDKCLVAINLYACKNSGFYIPKAVRIDGVTGWFMINQDGSIFFECRVIKEDEKKYRIEYMTTEGYNIFEKCYCELID